MERCIAEGLVGGEGFAVDASLIEADANRQRSIPSSDWNRQRDRNLTCFMMPLHLPSRPLHDVRTEDAGKSFSRMRIAC